MVDDLSCVNVGQGLERHPVALLFAASYAYRIKIETRELEKRVASLRGEVTQRRGAVATLNAEWAYLNRPDRLRELVNLNFSRLKLVPFTADQFVDVGQVAFPAPVQPEADGDDPSSQIPRPDWYPPRRPKESTP